jgi:hypothetical protein
VKDSIEVLRLINGGDVGRLFDDADQALVARGAGAIYAGIDVGNVVADGAETKIGFDITDSDGEGFGVFIAGAENVKSQALRALGSNARELFQLIDQARHGFGESVHWGIG